MATKVLKSIVCDYCAIDTDAKHVISFGLGAASYDADVCEKHKKDLDKQMSIWIHNARQTKKPRRPSK